MGSEPKATCMCCEPSVDQGQAINQVPGEMSPELEQLREFGFGLIYETGAPVSMDDLAARSGWSVDHVAATLAEIEEAGRARRDHQGRLVGIAGLSLEPSTHFIEIDGREFWTWCALDAVGIFGALKATGRVLSTPPGSNQQLEIRYENGTTESQHALFLSDGYDGTNVFESWCANVNFFPTVEEAENFATENGLDGDVVAISEVSEMAEAIWAPVVAGVKAFAQASGDQPTI